MIIDTGILLVNKPAGLSSFGVVSRIKRILAPLRVGHGGTLDPAATGLLPLLVGRATKWADQIHAMAKTYRFTMRLGCETDTDDLTGVITRQTDYSHVSWELVKEVMERHVGDVLQTPPMYSALWYQGRRLYDWAREGYTVPRKERLIKIYSMELLGMDLPSVELRATCSRGTYIRTLCRDMGKNLGTAATLEFLVRERVGDMRLEDSLALDVLTGMKKDEIKSHLKSIEDFSRLHPALREGGQANMSLSP